MDSEVEPVTFYETIKLATEYTNRSFKGQECE